VCTGIWPRAIVCAGGAIAVMPLGSHGLADWLANANERSMSGM
jgi:hypothetical protein